MILVIAILMPMFQITSFIFKKFIYKMNMMFDVVIELYCALLLFFLLSIAFNQTEPLYLKILLSTSL